MDAFQSLSPLPHHQALSSIGSYADDFQQGAFPLSAATRDLTNWRSQHITGYNHDLSDFELFFTDPGLLDDAPPSEGTHALNGSKLPAADPYIYSPHDSAHESQHDLFGAAAPLSEEHQILPCTRGWAGSGEQIVSFGGVPRQHFEDDYASNERLVEHAPAVEVYQQPARPSDFEDDEDRGVESTDRCYAYLLWCCLSEAPGNMLPLRGIYEWVLRNSQKARRDPGRGWQNSVRHNLSMNAAFEKVANGTGQGSKRGNLWRLHPDFADGVQPTTQYRRDQKRSRRQRGQAPAQNKKAAGQKGGRATSAKLARLRQEYRAQSTQQQSRSSFPPAPHQQQGFYDGSRLPWQPYPAGRVQQQPVLIMPAPTPYYLHPLPQHATSFRPYYTGEVPAPAFRAGMVDFGAGAVDLRNEYQQPPQYPGTLQYRDGYDFTAISSGPPSSADLSFMSDGCAPHGAETPHF